MRLLLLLVLSTLTTGCELVGDIFQAGLVVGIIIVVLIVALISWLVRGFRRRKGTS